MVFASELLTIRGGKGETMEETWEERERRWLVAVEEEQRRERFGGSAPVHQSSFSLLERECSVESAESGGRTENNFSILFKGPLHKKRRTPPPVL